MKKLNVVVILMLCLFLLVSCSSGEVNSERDARRILLQTSDEISECISYLEDDFENKDLKKIETRLDNALESIKSTEDYCVDDAVNSRYESAMREYNKGIKLLNKLKGEE